MKQTVVAVFESPLQANETVHVLVQARFVAERLPHISRERAQSRRSAALAAWQALRCGIHDFLDADSDLPPYAQALASGRFIVKVHVEDDAEALAARRILETAGGQELDALDEERTR
jgi:hypothetical protein